MPTTLRGLRDSDEFATGHRVLDQIPEVLAEGDVLLLGEPLLREDQNLVLQPSGLQQGDSIRVERLREIEALHFGPQGVAAARDFNCQKPQEEKTLQSF